MTTEEPTPCVDCGRPGIFRARYDVALCKSHHTLRLRRDKRASNPCQVAGCDNGEYSRGLCSFHYKARRSEQLGGCIGPDCTGHQFSRGMCHAHWRQWSKGLPLTPLKPHNKVVDGMKRCPDCGETKPVDQFHKKKGKPSHRCAACVGIHNRMTTYNLTRDEVELMLEHRTCDACGEVVQDLKQFHIDHSHTTGVVRGVLCSGCNTTLGLVKESAATLRALAAYIERHTT